jgi:HK97 family phage major capsid protein
MSNWINQKAHFEQLATKAAAIRDRAKAETRDLSPTEAAEHDRIMGELERHQNAQKRSLVGRGDHNATSATTGGEEAWALQNGQSCRDFLRAQGKADYEGLSFGAYIRSMVCGPRNDLERRALAEGTDSSGGYSVPDVLFGEVVDRLRPNAVTIAAGAKVVPLTSDQNRFVKILTDPAATWRSENASVNVADGTFGAVSFAPKTLGVLVKASRELLEDSLNIEEAVNLSFARSFGSELDRVALVGDSANGEPVGLANMSVNAVSMGTNGAAIANYGKILDAHYECELDNATPTALVAHPRTMRAINGLVDSTGQPLNRPAAIENLPFFSTSGLPIDETEGTSSNASSIFIGDFSRLWIGVRTALRVEVLRETFAGNLQYAFLAYMRCDVQASHENAFCKLTGIIP